MLVAFPDPPTPAAGRMNFRSRGLRPNFSNNNFSKARNAFVPITPFCAAVSASDVPGLMFIKQLGSGSGQMNVLLSLEAAAAMTLVIDTQFGTYVGHTRCEAKRCSICSIKRVSSKSECFVCSIQEMGGSSFSPLKLSFCLKRVDRRLTRAEASTCDGAEELVRERRDRRCCRRGYR